MLILCLPKTSAQGFPGGTGERIEGKFKFVPLPYINYDVAVGISVGAIPMAMFNLSEKDTISPSSIGGLGGIYSENGSWFGFGFGRSCRRGILCEYYESPSLMRPAEQMSDPEDSGAHETSCVSDAY